MGVVAVAVVDTGVEVVGVADDVVVVAGVVLDHVVEDVPFGLTVEEEVGVRGRHFGLGGFEHLPVPQPQLLVSWPLFLLLQPSSSRPPVSFSRLHSLHPQPSRTPSIDPIYHSARLQASAESHRLPNPRSAFS